MEKSKNLVYKQHLIKVIASRDFQLPSKPKQKDLTDEIVKFSE